MTTALEAPVDTFLTYVGLDENGNPFIEDPAAAEFIGIVTEADTAHILGVVEEADLDDNGSVAVALDELFWEYVGDTEDEKGMELLASIFTAAGVAVATMAEAKEKFTEYINE